MKGQLDLSVWRLSRQGVEQFGRSEPLVFLLDHQLSFLDHVQNILNIKILFFNYI